MIMKSDPHIFSGMQKDMSISKHKAEFLHDARNIRITNIEGDTLLSIVNEKGPAKKKTSDQQDCKLNGYYLGHCVFPDYVIFFTTSPINNSLNKDYIYKVNNNGDIVLIFEGALNFDQDHAIETLGVFENNLVIKVYWTDGKNQPRVINVSDNNIQNISNKTKQWPIIDTQFDFVPTLKLEEEITVSRITGGGMFAPGTIQYAFAYYNLYGQESNIFYTTPLHYISYMDRGGNPTQKIANIFRIKVENIDTNFQYIRVFSIHRTSIDAAPMVKRVIDININSNSTIQFDDDGTIGDNIDPYELLYIGGEIIKAQTISQVDNTLFLGNISIDRSEPIFKTQDVDSQEYDDTQTDTLNYSFSTIKQSTVVPTIGSGKGYYHYTNSLPYSIRGFKNREHYRLGIQFQHISGKWSAPLFLKDYTVFLGDDGPNLQENQDESIFSTLNIQCEISLPTELIQTLESNNYIKIRPICVFPTLKDRLVLTQGLLCPTVYNINNRINNTPFSQSSWFFRPISNKRHYEVETIKDGRDGSWVEFRHNHTLKPETMFGGEVMGASASQYGWIFSGDMKETDPTTYGVDQSILTMHSPDIEFDTNFAYQSDNNWKLRIVGLSNLTSNIGDISIKTSSAASSGTGFSHYTVGHQDSEDSFKGLVAGPFWHDGIIFYRNPNSNDNNERYYFSTKLEANMKDYIVYPWHRQGSLNNDVIRPAGKGIRTAELETKKIANLRFFKNTTWLPVQYNPSNYYYPSYNYYITKVQLFDDDQVSMVKIQDVDPEINSRSFVYYGNVDTMYSLKQNNAYKSKIEKIVNGESTIGSLMDDNSIKGEDLRNYDTMQTDTNVNVRMSYKSSKHLIFGIKYDEQQQNHAHRQSCLPTIHINDGSSVRLLNNTQTVEDNYVDGHELTPANSPFKYIPSWITGDEPIRNRLGELTEILPYNTNLNTWMTNNLPSDNLTQESQDAYNYYNNSIIAIKLDADGDNIQIVLLQPNVTQSYDTDHGTYESYVWYSRQTDLQYEYYAYNDGTQILYRIDSSNSSIGHKMDSSEYLQNISNYLPVQKVISLNSQQYPINYPYMYLGELYREPTPDTDFGGLTQDAKMHNIWLPAGKAENLIENNEYKSQIELKYTEGDSWYTRYDCLKTYPFTEEDNNSIIEIGSFMCESRVNMDGRYDRNRGSISNILNMRPTNFNLFNPIYSQLDNFFNYTILSNDYYKLSSYPSTITWSKDKLAAQEIDLWTNITLANTLDLDGTMGEVTALRAFNGNLFCFQTTALSKILYNSRVQIQPSDGVPIEIANSGKVDGKVYLSTSVGCTNKNSICSTLSGLYFIDSNSKQLYNLGDQLANVSDSRDFKDWFRSKQNNNTEKTFYDFNNNDLYLIWDDECLVYSEKLGQFVSFMDYNDVPAMYNIKDSFYCVKEYIQNDLPYTQIWTMFEGDYCNFFGNRCPYEIEFISNEDSAIDKTFNTIESRFDFWINDQLQSNKNIDYIRVSNEYQDTGKTPIVSTSSFNFNTSTSGKKKFRIWRTLIPRAMDSEGNNRTLNRIRNTWATIKLGMNIPTTEQEKYLWDKTKFILHDVSVQYYI